MQYNSNQSPSSIPSSAGSIRYEPGSLSRKGDNESNLVVDYEIHWDDLQLREEIGQGSFASVYHGIWNGSDVAVGVYFGNEYGEGTLLDYKKEIDIMRRLRHPNVLLFMGAVYSGEQEKLAIVSEFLPRSGYSVSDLILQARGMNYLHHRNPPIVHRDLKSSNLLLDKNWTVKVVGIVGFMDRRLDLPENMDPKVASDVFGSNSQPKRANYIPSIVIGPICYGEGGRDICPICHEEGGRDICPIYHGEGGRDICSIYHVEGGHDIRTVVPDLFRFFTPLTPFSVRLKAFSTLTPNLQVRITFHQLSQVLFVMGKLSVRVTRWFRGCFEFLPPESPFSTKFRAYSALTPNLLVRITFRQLAQVLFVMGKLAVRAT
ncbi:hypothetical protein TEA_026640 [Camellia sinensis var. sinensis]|uniref:Protein kinase domain-containing protein n=1 Tax=Camellia sinensis var. sinensis TaxID=542762 RepID=A0A4S4EX90_CAMSN|nr:hypothetical protein TEA_026640 [Camellia sinensis var. sinensis]